MDNQSINSFEMRNQSVYSLEGSNQGSLKADATRRERDVLRKGIERMQKQIYQLIKCSDFPGTHRHCIVKEM